jgi:uncharacterized membrane protein
MTGAFYMDALITPARSLAKRGRYIVLAAMAAMALIPAVVFTLMGAPFVLPFMGLDIAGLALAFWVISRRTSAEQVRVSRETIEVLRNGAEVWRSPVAFTRIEQFETSVRLGLRGKTYSLASDLSPIERTEFAAALQLAVIAAKAGSSYPRRDAKAAP